MNTIETLKNLTKEFPEFNTEILIKILECYVDNTYTIPINLENTSISTDII